MAVSHTTFSDKTNQQYFQLTKLICLPLYPQHKTELLCACINAHMQYHMTYFHIVTHNLSCEINPKWCIQVWYQSRLIYSLAVKLHILSAQKIGMMKPWRWLHWSDSTNYLILVKIVMDPHSNESSYHITTFGWVFGKKQKQKQKQKSYFHVTFWSYMHVCN